MIEVKNISKKFIVKNSIVHALDNVSLKIKENDCINMSNNLYIIFITKHQSRVHFQKL